MSTIPSENLLGISLVSGWEVTEMLIKHPGDTGGHFSTGYKVMRSNQKGFLKALDFSEAFASQDPARRLQELTEAYNFERDLPNKCKVKNLSKVVCPIEDGTIDVPGFPIGINKVYYIIFELADGNIRKIKDTFIKIDLAFIFRSLHNIAVGLEQLHKAEIAHQDIKPSNVLVFNRNSKISDIGRASDKNRKFIYDSYKIPGDRNYAPIEQLYDFHFSGDFNEKYAADIYQFGSLFFFYFSGLSASQAYINKAVLLNINYTGSFEQDLPEINRVFDEIINDMRNILQKLLDINSTDEIIQLIACLCKPDPRSRGYKKNVDSHVNQYSLERVVSRLEYYAKKAEFAII
jgi:eukaryotic-like serine/threonine-protein kinase